MVTDRHSSQSFRRVSERKFRGQEDSTEISTNDQGHEQSNAAMEYDGGAVGLTENLAALRRWMVSGLEMATLIRKLEASIN